MNVTLSHTIPSSAKGILLCVYAGDIKKQIQAAPVSASVKKQLQNSGKLISGNALSSISVPLSGGGKELAVIVGLGKKNTIRQSVIERAIRLGVKNLRTQKQKRVAILAPAWEDLERATYITTFNAVLSNYVFAPYKKTKDTLLQSLVIVVPGKKVDASVRSEFTKAKIVAEETNGARTLSNTPGGDMTPKVLAKRAKEIGKESGFTVKVFGERKIKELGMGGILGVSRGSEEEAQLILAEYFPKNAVNKKPIVFVGKGVTFDTGGLNVKPDMSMTDMHMDMSGGSSVIHALAAIVRQKLPVSVVAIVPSVENMPSGAGYRPGDILKTYSGKTIEVKHTDAEGRIILADALGYAKTYNPEVVIDVATLTGAAIVALGQRAAGILSPDTSLVDSLIECGGMTGDRVWPLPLWDDYKAEVKGTFGDVANMGKTKFGGAITAGIFLWEFAPIKKWAHIDIAPTMVAIEDDFLAPGSKGAGVHLLTNFAERYAEQQQEK